MLNQSWIPNFYLFLEISIRWWMHFALLTQKIFPVLFYQLQYCYLTHPLLDSHSIYIATMKHHYTFNSQLILLRVVKLNFLISWNQWNIAEIHVFLVTKFTLCPTTSMDFKWHNNGLYYKRLRVKWVLC